ncbi:helix-turn-helix domain-containing protein [Scytonema sp. NUACC26]|uniref:helix-turn-helix domain-containing protein n=1 Tax=Scytonema sp. NUACC26 TaxID=3140176 RepID=UPI0034DBEB33
MGSYLDMNQLATMVRTKRGIRGLRETAKEIGNISPSTLSRVENSKMPDMETFLLLCDWLEVPPAELIKSTEEAGNPSVLKTPDAIAIQLRADKNLDPAIANALAALVKAAYHDLSQGNTNPKQES